MGTFLLKGISFITTPIFTRLLNTSDFGITAVFTTWVTFFSVFIAGQVSGSVGTARIHMSDDKFNSYLRNITILGITCASAVISVSLLFRNELAAILRIEVRLIPDLLIQAFGTAMSMLYITYLIQTKQPKKQIIFAVLVSIVTVILSIYLVLSLEQNKYMGKIMGASIANVAIIIFVLTYFLRKNGEKVNLSDWKFCLMLSMPLIVHLVANIVIGQSNRVILNQLLGTTETSIYSVAHSVGLLGMLFADACNNAWSPWYLERTKSGETNSVNKYARNYIFVICSTFVVVLLLAPEIVKIMAPQPYWGSTKTIIIITVSVFFQFLYRFPLGYEQYAKNLKWVAACTITTALLNVSLNYFLIPMLGIEGAGWATLVSYITLFGLHELVARCIIKQYNIKFQSYIPSVAICFSVAIFAYLFINIWYLRYLGICIYLAIFLLWIRRTQVLKIIRY